MQSHNVDDHMTGLQIANMLVAAKADDVCILDVSSQCSFTEHMVLATGRSHRHIQAAAAAVAYQVGLDKATSHVLLLHLCSLLLAYTHGMHNNACMLNRGRDYWLTQMLMPGCADVPALL